MESAKKYYVRQALMGETSKVREFAQRQLDDDDKQAQHEVDEKVAQFMADNPAFEGRYEEVQNRVLDRDPELRVRFERETERNAMPPHLRKAQ